MKKIYFKTLTLCAFGTLCILTATLFSSCGDDKFETPSQGLVGPQEYNEYIIEGIVADETNKPVVHAVIYARDLDESGNINRTIKDKSISSPEGYFRYGGIAHDNTAMVRIIARNPADPEMEDSVDIKLNFDNSKNFFKQVFIKLKKKK